MLYRDHRKYNSQQTHGELGLLQGWLEGEAGVENLKEWLSIMYN